MAKTLEDTPNQDHYAFWDAYTWRWRIKRMTERLLGWEVFLSWESYLRKYAPQEYGLGSGKSFTTPTPVAFCAGYGDKDWEYRVFTPDHEELTPFKPLENLDDAWQLVQALARQNHPEAQKSFFRAIRLNTDTTPGTAAAYLLNAVYDAVRCLDGEFDIIDIRREEQITLQCPNCKLTRFLPLNWQEIMQKNVPPDWDGKLRCTACNLVMEPVAEETTD